MPILFLFLQRFWAALRGDHTRALQLSKDILMADLTALSAAVDRVAAKHQANADALAAAQAADATTQSQVDALTAKLAALAPEATADTTDQATA